MRAGVFCLQVDVIADGVIGGEECCNGQGPVSK